MPVSLVHLDTLNVDPLPPDSWAARHTFGASAIYGLDAADGGGLDSADGTGSYIQIGAPLAGDTVRVVTARLTADPPLPPTAVGDPFDATAWESVQMQGQGLLGGRLVGATPYFEAFSSLDFNRTAFAWVPPATFANDGRWITQDDVGPSLLNGYVVDNTQFVDLLLAGGYVVISTGNERADLGINLSQIVAAVAWTDSGVKWHTIGGHSGNPTGGPNLRILTPGVGWVERVDGPA